LFARMVWRGRPRRRLAATYCHLRVRFRQKEQYLIKGHPGKSKGKMPSPRS
jgi:hypothetical protein